MNNRNTRYPRMHGGNDLYLYDKIDVLAKAVKKYSGLLAFLSVAAAIFAHAADSEFKRLDKEISELKRRAATKETTQEE